MGLGPARKPFIPARAWTAPNPPRPIVRPCLVPQPLAYKARDSSQEEILWLLSLVPDVEHVDGIPTDHEEDLVRIEQALADGFGEKSVFVRHPALLGRLGKIPYGGSNPAVPLIGYLEAGLLERRS